MYPTYARPAHRVGRFNIALAIICALALFVALCAWAVSSPNGSSWDEDYHQASIWCSHGTKDGLCAPAVENTRLISKQFQTFLCFVHKQEVSAQCAAQNHDQSLTETDRGNFNNNYPPVFYYFDGFFAGQNVPRSVVAMRVANALSCLALLTAAALVAPARIRRGLIIAALVTSVPYGIYLMASINPSGWGYVGTTVTLTSAATFLTSRARWRQVASAITCCVAVAMAAGSRGDSAIFSALALVSAVLLSREHAAFRWRRCLWLTPLMLTGLATYTLVQQSTISMTAPGAIREFSWSSTLDTVLRMPDFWIGVFGHWGLGWTDSDVYPAVWVSAAALYLLTLTHAASKMTRWQTFAFALLLFAFLVIPTYVQISSGLPFGKLVQPRYFLPLLALLITTSAIRPWFQGLTTEPFSIGPKFRWFIIVVLAAGNSITLHSHMRRYITGSDILSWNLNYRIEWWWETPFSPEFIWIVGSVAFCVGIILLSRQLLPLPDTHKSPSDNIERPQHRASRRGSQHW